jgi:hypothetical protein
VKLNSTDCGRRFGVARMAPALGCMLLLFACAAAPRQPPAQTRPSPPPDAGQGGTVAGNDTTGPAAGDQVRPKVAIVVKEMPEDDIAAVDDRMLETEPTEVLIADAFQSRGFPVAEAAKVRQNLDRDRLRQILEGDDQTAAAVGLATEADVMVAGTVQEPRENQAAADETSGVVRVRLAARAVNTATGTVLGSTLLELTGQGNEDAVRQRAADSAVAELSARLLEAWKGRTNITEIYADNADYQRVQFLESAITNEASGVDSVTTLSLSERSAVIEVFSRLSPDQLIVQIDRCNTAIPFVVKAFSGNRIDIRFLDAPQQCEPDLK